MFVKPGQQRDDPANPLLVRKPNRQLLSPDGEDVPETNFWFRRLRDGDVVLVELEPEPKPAGPEAEPQAAPLVLATPEPIAGEPA